MKTTGLIGFVQVVGVIFGIIRTKFIAIILGSSGFGIFSLYNGLLDFANSASQFGAGIGGIRQLSKEQSEGNTEGVRQIVFVLRSWIIATTSVVCLFIIVFSPQINGFQFGISDHVSGIRIISFAVIFGNLYNIHIAILNGVRQLRAMAKSQLLATIGGVAIALPIIYYSGRAGIEISILAVAVFNCFVSYYFVRKSGFSTILIKWSQFKIHFHEILKVGLSFALPGAVSASLVYIVRWYLKEKFNFEVLGIYQACFVLSTMYVQTILSAMGADFLPRLMSVKDDDVAINLKVNEQMEFGVLIASIGVFATFILAPVLLSLFYSSQFISGAVILRWQIIAVFLRVLEWPLGFTLSAKGRNVQFMIQQTVYYLFEFGTICLLSHFGGILGLAISYLLSYSLFLGYRYFAVRRITGFSFSPLLKRILRIILAYLSVITILIVLIPTTASIPLSLAVLIGYIFTCHRILRYEMGIDLIKIFSQKLLSKTSNLK